MLQFDTNNRNHQKKTIWTNISKSENTIFGKLNVFPSKDAFFTIGAGVSKSVKSI